MHNVPACQLFRAPSECGGHAAALSRGNRGRRHGRRTPRYGIRLASALLMSRVERTTHPPAPRQAQQDRRSLPRRTPGQAEGDERTVDEALRNQEKRNREE